MSDAFSLPVVSQLRKREKGKKGKGVRESSRGASAHRSLFCYVGGGLGFLCTLFLLWNLNLSEHGASWNSISNLSNRMVPLQATDQVRSELLSEYVMQSWASGATTPSLLSRAIDARFPDPEWNDGAQLTASLRSCFESTSVDEMPEFEAFSGEQRCGAQTWVLIAGAVAVCPSCLASTGAMSCCSHVSSLRLTSTIHSGGPLSPFAERASSEGFSFALAKSVV